MSILSGVLAGAELVVAIGAALDPSHHPFKRSATRPGGPAGRKDSAQGAWECNWSAPYVQKCVSTEDPTVKKTVRIKKTYKKKYNKAYRAGKFPKGKRFHADRKRKGAKYAPKHSSGWAKDLAKRKSKKA